MLTEIYLVNGRVCLWCTCVINTVCSSAVLRISYMH